MTKPTQAQIEAAFNECWELMQMAEHVARIYGIGFGKQPTAWGKAEIDWLADAHKSGRWRKAMETLAALTAAARAAARDRPSTYVHYS